MLDSPCLESLFGMQNAFDLQSFAHWASALVQSFVSRRRRKTMPRPIAWLVCDRAEMPGPGSSCHTPASDETGQRVSFVETACVFLSLFLRPVRFWGYWIPTAKASTQIYQDSSEATKDCCTTVRHRQFCLDSKLVYFPFLFWKA